MPAPTTPTSTATSANLPEPPFPTIILMGCQPNLLPPKPVHLGPCPVCGGGIRPEHPRYYCAQCDSLSPANEAKARGARIGLVARGASAKAEAKLKLELRRKAGGATLSEHERRLIWNGYRGSVNRQLEDQVLGVYGRVGREWLMAIDQAPQWDLIIDRYGQVVGRHPDASESDHEA